MARGLGDLLVALRATEEAIGTIGPRRAAERIAAELQDVGPAWTGTFRNAWRIAPGDQDVPVSIARPVGYVPGQQRPTPQPVARQKVPPVGLGRRFSAVFTKNKTLYTIGNASEHRLIAMDLVPGRRLPSTPPRKPRNWFETYVKAGGLERSINVELSRAIKEARK